MAYISCAYILAKSYWSWTFLLGTSTIVSVLSLWYCWGCLWAERLLLQSYRLFFLRYQRLKLQKYSNLPWWNYRLLFRWYWRVNLGGVVWKSTDRVSCHLYPQIEYLCSFQLYTSRSNSDTLLKTCYFPVAAPQPRKLWELGRPPSPPRFWL